MIASRNRPRIGGKYPWPLRTVATTESEIYNGQMMPNRIGPLPLAAMMELVWRVKAFSWAGSVTYDFGGSPATDTGSGAIETEFGEVEFFRRCRVDPFLTPFPPGQRPTSPEFEPDGGFQALADNVSTPDHLGEIDIAEDENGMFWIRGFFDFFVDLTTSSGNATVGTNDTGGTAFLFDATLVLSAGSFPIRAIALSFDTSDITAAALTITATKWHSYGGKYDVDTGNLA